MKKVCAKMVPKIPLAEQRAKGNLFWPSGVHSEQTIFVEISNYLWWDLDVYVTQKQNDYQCTRSHQTLQGQKKVAWVVRSLRPCWLFSLISWVLWWQSGYPVASQSALLYWNPDWIEWVRRNGQDCGKMGGFCIRKTCHAIILYLYSSF
jgi:hypothetical protein